MMEKETDFCTFVVLEASRCWIAQRLDDESTLTVLALISEDPSSWEEALSGWPRYRNPAVCEFPSGLPFEEKNRAEVMEVLANSESWVVVDFPTKRILNGGSFEAVGRDAAFTMVPNQRRTGKSQLFIHLPPWWELREGVSLFSLDEPRQEPMNKPIVNREILYGDALLIDIAERSLAVVASPEWQIADRQQRDYHDLTVRLHRDWLMTPRKDLGGKIPRELLHGAIEWNEQVTHGQELRYEQGGTLIAAPADWPGYATAPMGSQEMCMYFDYCREVIRLAWVWCLANDVMIATADHQTAISEMVDTLRENIELWLSGSFEGGPSPSFVIECDRRRVPIGDGVVIEGIDGGAKERHIEDCNCPICKMMADGLFGTSFSRIDGHHLELDDEFAFSMEETVDDWECKQQEYLEFSEGFEERRSTIRPIEDDEPFGSAWVGVGGDRPIPGDRLGHLKMAFMVAEIIAVLEGHSHREEEIKSLNQAFSEYRKSQGSQTKKSKKKLKKILESLAKRYPELVSKSADLQSYIDEAGRALIGDRNKPGFL